MKIKKSILWLSIFAFTLCFLVGQSSCSTVLQNEAELKFVSKLLWILAGCAIIIFFIILWHQNRNDDDENDSYPL
jgi:hypothetical protein